MLHTRGIILLEDKIMNKTISISIRVSEEDLNKFKQAAELESYASYSEFIIKRNNDGDVQNVRICNSEYKRIS